jgi:xanthine dehydrogenase accessory factor
MTPSSYLVIVTRGHMHDLAVLRKAVNTPCDYLGMIGSKRKIKIIFDALRQEGVSERNLKKVHAPIGLDIGGETPEEIAVSIVAELIQTRNR